MQMNSGIISRKTGFPGKGSIQIDTKCSFFQESLDFLAEIYYCIKSKKIQVPVNEVQEDSKLYIMIL